MATEEKQAREAPTPTTTTTAAPAVPEEATGEGPFTADAAGHVTGTEPADDEEEV